MKPRVFHVGLHDAGVELQGWLKAHLHLPSRDAHELVRGGRVFVDGKPCVDAARRLKRGQRVELRGGGRSRAPQARAGTAPLLLKPAAIRHIDEDIVVVDKPPGLTTVRHAEDLEEFGRRAQRFLPPTLADLLPALLARREGGASRPVRAVHRLDRDTSGLVVLARTVEAERHLGEQFRAHTAERVYQAIVRGQARDGRIESWLVRDRGDGRRGSSTVANEGQHAVTHVRVLERLGDYSLVECRLETGRTHQVRIHLGEAGTPLCGERIYDRPRHGRPAPDGSGLKRVALHAAVLGIDHPRSGRRLRWTAPLPDDLHRLLGRLREKPN